MIEKILERLEAERNEAVVHDDDYFLGKYCAYDDAIKIVKEVAKDGGWIPCSERLPNNTDDVLVTTAYGLVIDAFLSVNRKWCFRNGRRITDSADMPIAWQPLPAPYQKGE